MTVPHSVGDGNENFKDQIVIQCSPSSPFSLLLLHSIRLKKVQIKSHFSFLFLFTKIDLRISYKRPTNQKL